MQPVLFTRQMKQNVYPSHCPPPLPSHTLFVSRGVGFSIWTDNQSVRQGERDESRATRQIKFSRLKSTHGRRSGLYHPHKTREPHNMCSIMRATRWTHRFPGYTYAKQLACFMCDVYVFCHAFVCGNTCVCTRARARVCATCHSIEVAHQE